MSVTLTKIADKCFARIARDRQRPDLELSLRSSVLLHLSNPDIERKSFRMDDRPEWKAKLVYLFQMGEWGVVWSLESDEVMVWFIKELANSYLDIS